MLIKFLIALATLSSTQVFAVVTVGEHLPVLAISDTNGGKVDGNPFTSEELKGKPQLIFYVDPDEEKLNESLEQALKKEAFPESKLGSVAIINMKATWMPDFAIATVLKSKQEEFKDTLYVKDLSSYVVSQWQLSDNNYSVILIDKEQKVLYKKEGKFSDAETEELIALIKNIL